MNKYNFAIYENINSLLLERNTTIYSIAKRKKVKRGTIEDKINRLKNGLGISTTSLYELADFLEVPVYFLIK